MQKTLIMIYPGLGKTYLAENYENVMDFEQQHYISLYDEDVRHLPLEQIKGATNKRKPNPDWPQNYIDGIKSELDKGRIVTTTLIPDTYKALCETDNFTDVRIILVVFEPDNFEELADRYRDRGNTEQFVERRRSDFPIVVDIFNKAKGVEKVTITSGEYSAQALIRSGLHLKKGVGFKNYF